VRGPDDAGPDDAEYIRASISHAAQIYGIERLSFAAPWPRESFERELGDSLARYFIARLPSAHAGIFANGGDGDKVIIGYCGYWSIVGEAHITNVAVHPDFRGKGYGSGLLRAMLRDMRETGHSAATLEVREDNHAAIRLYEGFGFKRAGVRKNYYEREKKDAIIMWKIFSHDE
jgi:ribosomal-protein-alanine N-acetyltransferase